MKMKFTVVGTGVIGTTYGWQLASAGHEVVHWVRNPTMRDTISSEGIPIRCLDLRSRRPKEIETVYRPRVTASLSAQPADVVLVSVNSHQLASLLPQLRQVSKHASILFLQNLRLGEDELIAAHLSPDQYVLGYPFRAGGGRDGQVIDTVIFGNLLSHTMLGHVDGKVTARLESLGRALNEAGMRPRTCRKTIAYVRTHYVWAAASIGAFLKAGSYERFLSQAIQREAYIAMREGWEICRAQGIDPRSVSPTRYYYLPLWILVPLTRKMYDGEGMRRMFEGHVRHSPEEIRTMYDDVARLGDRYGLSMPTYRGFAPFVSKYCASLQLSESSLAARSPSTIRPVRE